MSGAETEIKPRLIEHVVKNGPDLGFTSYFWRGCEPLPRDIRDYGMFVQVITLSMQGLQPGAIAAQTGVSEVSIRNWNKLLAVPKLVHFLKTFIRMGPSTPNKVWLTFEHSQGRARPIGQFAQVPKVVRSWNQVQSVIDQIRSLPLSLHSEFSMVYRFGFLLGVMIGDANKPKQGRGHRHLDLVMSKK